MIAPTARPWLPRNALRDETIVASTAERADKWAIRWFGEAVAANVRKGASIGHVKMACDTVCWESSCQGLVLATDAPGRVRIVSAMLGVKTAWLKLTEADLELFDELAAPCIEDLLGGLAELFQTGPRTGMAPPNRIVENALSFSLGFGSATPAIDIFVHEHLAVAARKATISGGRPAPVLGQRNEAIARQTVQIGAKLGVGQVGLSELCTLACGDVLVLDRAFGDRLALTVNGEAKPDTGCELHQDGAVLKLRVAHLEQIGAP